MQLPDCSIIVCTYNRADMLRDALASLVTQETDGWFGYEVVVVDNASTDDTAAAIAEAAARSSVPLRGVVERQGGIAYARQRGIQEARGQWFAFFDDDQVADRRWLLELMTMARRRKIRCVGGAVHLRLPQDCRRELAPICRALLGESVDMPAPLRYGRKVAPGCGNLLVHRSVFQEVGGFDLSLDEAGEDTDLFRRIRAAGIEAWYTPRAVVEHVIRPARLCEASLRLTAWRVGGHVARREHAEYGRLALSMLTLARTAKTMVASPLGRLSAGLRRDREAAAGARCAEALALGYLRGALQLIAPRLFHQETLVSRLAFRADPFTRQQTPGAVARERSSRAAPTSRCEVIQ
ncbi:MAG: glycosyltransferase family A protein [Thermoguttaceae bacterium]|jgi:GT2 family glycosyltransferase